jgi:hypothetical protein
VHEVRLDPLEDGVGGLVRRPGGGEEGGPLKRERTRSKMESRSSFGEETMSSSETRALPPAAPWSMLMAARRSPTERVAMRVRAASVQARDSFVQMNFSRGTICLAWIARKRTASHLARISAGMA